VGNLGEEEVGSFYDARFGRGKIYQILQKNKIMPARDTSKNTTKELRSLPLISKNSPAVFQGSVRCEFPQYYS
jgi:hypothetical protein